MSLVETDSLGSERNRESSTGVEMATELIRLRKNLEGVVLKGKRMAASSRRYKIALGQVSAALMATDEVAGILACAVHL